MKLEQFLSINSFTLTSKKTTDDIFEFDKKSPAQIRVSEAKHVLCFQTELLKVYDKV